MLNKLIFYDFMRKKIKKNRNSKHHIYVKRFKKKKRCVGRYRNVFEYTSNFKN